MPNGLRYPLVGGTGQRRFDGINLKPRKPLENAQTPTSRVHAVLGGGLPLKLLWSVNKHLLSDNALNIAFKQFTYQALCPIE